MRKPIVVLIVALILIAVSLPLYADNKGSISVKQTITPVGAKITIVSGNMITISDDQGHSKTLLLESARGLTVGMKTGWCEEDCGKIKIGNQDVRVKQVIENKR
ncbi:MAG: hypothetical protein M0036_23435 [Desulfobacteraceae bacterium]|nr:hypothetical protein [Desulfobacteraceae bacterium]